MSRRTELRVLHFLRKIGNGKIKYNLLAWYSSDVVYKNWWLPTSLGMFVAID